MVLTDASIDLQKTINSFCRAQTPPISVRMAVSAVAPTYSSTLSLPLQFISSSVRGVFSSVFCDFGAEFTVLDNNGEEPSELFVANITKVTILASHTAPIIMIH